MEAILPYEIQIPSLRVQLYKDLPIDKRREALLAQKKKLDELKLKAAEHVQAYQRRISRSTHALPLAWFRWYLSHPRLPS